MDAGGSNSPAETADNITQGPVEPKPESTEGMTLQQQNG